MSTQKSLAAFSDMGYPVELDTPLRRHRLEFSTLYLRTPSPRDLKGLALRDLIDMDVNALSKLLPRISRPVLKRKEIAAMHPGDLAQCGFFVAEILASVMTDPGQSPTCGTQREH